MAKNTKMIGFTVSLDDYDYLEKRAENLGMTKASFVKFIVKRVIEGISLGEISAELSDKTRGL